MNWIHVKNNEMIAEGIGFFWRFVFFLFALGIDFFITVYERWA